MILKTLIAQLIGAHLAARDRALDNEDLVLGVAARLDGRPDSSARLPHRNATIVSVLACAGLQRTRVWQPVAAAVGLATRERKFTTEFVDGQRRRRQTSRYEGPGPYHLRGSFVSLLIQEGKTVVYVANQAGHTPETCLRQYARLFRDAPTVSVPAEVAIRQAARGGGS